jgi:hypothetical protein
MHGEDPLDLECWRRLLSPIGATFLQMFHAETTSSDKKKEARKQGRILVLAFLRPSVCDFG